MFGADRIREDLTAVADEDRSTWPAAARAARLLELRSLQERIDAEVLRAVADCDAADAWSADCLGPVSWLAAKTAWCGTPRRGWCRGHGS